MKTLVIQLARLGDILQTLPALHAYCRSNSTEKIHFLVRKKFSEIAHILPVCDSVIEMDTKVILEASIFAGEDGVEDSLSVMQKWVERLKAEGYEKIINLSFSPFSSYLTSLLADEGVEVVGYTRHEDGFLAIPDDASAYFYGQVGVNRSNRFHLIDLFASILGVELEDQDWNLSKNYDSKKLENYIAFHIGASNPKKSLSQTAIVGLLRAIVKSSDIGIYLLGGTEDIAMAESIERQLGGSKIKNMVGKTNLAELIDIIAKSKAFMGADSGPMQICNLTNTLCINFSNEFVNFWETGPRSYKSFVCYVKDFSLLDMNEVALEIKTILETGSSEWIQGDRLGYHGAYPTTPSQDFQWSLIKAIYLGEEFPALESSQFARAVVHLNDVNDISLHHLANFQIGNRQQASVLETADKIMDTLATEVEEIMPIVYWFRTEKIRMGPVPLTDLIIQYMDLHKKLKQILELYLKPKWEITEDLL